MKIYSSFQDYYDGLCKSYSNDEINFYRTNSKTSKSVRDITELSKEVKSLDDAFSTKYNLWRSKYRSFILSGFLVFCGKVYGVEETWIHPNPDDILHKVPTGYKNFMDDEEYYLFFKPFDDFLHLNEKYNCPIILYKTYHQEYIREFNPILCQYEFSKFLTPFEIYQDLSYYLGNVLVEREQMPVPSNEEKIKMHGFDTKKSFRRK